MAIIKKGDNIIDVVYKGACEESEPTQYGAYNIDVVITPEGTQELHITDADEKPTDMLQARVDATNSCAQLFYFWGGKNLDFIVNLDTSNSTSMQSMFSGCMYLESIDLSNFNTDKVTNMLDMFRTCNALKSVDLTKFNTSNVKNMSYMFSGCYSLTELDVSNFDTSLVTEIRNMFENCSGLTALDVSNFNTSNVTSMFNVFTGCSKLTDLDLSNWDTSKVTNMYSMFQNCTALANLDLSNWDTSKVTNASQMFYSCKKLKTINNINLIKATNLANIFYQCMLENLYVKNVKANLPLGTGTSYGTLLSLDSLINTIKELWDYSSGTTTYKLTMSTPSKELIANTYVKLITPTEEQIAADPNIIYKMPCEVCQSTDEGAMLITDYATLKKWTIA